MRACHADALIAESNGAIRGRRVRTYAFVMRADFSHDRVAAKIRRPKERLLVRLSCRFVADRIDLDEIIAPAGNGALDDRVHRIGRTPARILKGKFGKDLID